MDKFRTPVSIPASAFKIGYDTPVLLMGSCFSDYIGKLMLEHKWPVLMNPFGTLFNPLSIADAFEKLITGSFTTRDDLSFHNGLWFSFSHYTCYSHPDREACLEMIRRSEQQASVWLKKCRFVIITFGTAWYYEIKDSGKVAANCHKLPASRFNHNFAQPGNIISRYESLYRMLKQFNPRVDVIFTVSPVRHWKDGAVNNQRSKSVLHWSIHQIMEIFPEIAYFPAYEIFMDELRDYRFYAADMLHPSEQGTRYIWDRFCDTYTEPATRKIMDDVASLLKAVHHRPQFKQTEEYARFRQSTLEKMEALTKAYPDLDFTSEKAFLL